MTAWSWTTRESKADAQIEEGKSLTEGIEWSGQALPGERNAYSLKKEYKKDWFGRNREVLKMVRIEIEKV